MSHKYIKFTGDYAKLKSMGYVFQKLYASNYMQWCHEDTGIRVWKRGSDVSIGCVINHTGVFLEALLNGGIKIRDKPLYGKSYGVVYTNRETGELTNDETGYYAEQKAWGKAVQADDEELLDTLPLNWSSVVISFALMHKLGELNKLGWIEVAEYNA